ncbi:MAG: STAS domain-containing protein [Fibrobacteria bacterium]|nr:STAS domain-containing protein [Fibrobacteria bacterium]
MSDFIATFENGVVKIILEGKLDALAAPKLADHLKTLVGQGVSKVVFFAEKLTFISSAGLRVIVFAKQKMGADVSVFLIKPPQEVVDVVNMTGFEGFLQIQETFEA